MRLRTATAVLGLSALAFVCADRRPIIFNDSAEAVSIEVSYDDATRTRAHLAPGHTLCIGDLPRRPLAVVIIREDGRRHAYNVENASELLPGPPDSSIAGWRISEGRVEPLHDRDLPTN